MKRLFYLIFAGLPLISLGQALPDVKLLDTGSGKTVSLSEYQSSPGVVIIFISNTCPYDGYYYSRIAKLTNAYNGKVPVLLVNAHRDNDESAESMKAKAQQLSLTVPYLADKEQTLMKELNATKSPEAFVLKNTGGKFTIFYRGAIDDNPQVEADVHTHYLKDAVNALLAGQKYGVPEVRPVGCTIRK